MDGTFVFCTDERGNPLYVKIVDCEYNLIPLVKMRGMDVDIPLHIIHRTELLDLHMEDLLAVCPSVTKLLKNKWVLFGKITMMPGKSLNAILP
jgi:hypothetical protein